MWVNPMLSIILYGTIGIFMIVGFSTWKWYLSE